MLKSKPSLKYKIAVLFPDILYYNKNLCKNRNKSLYYKDTFNFVRFLIELKDFDIIEKILPIISEDDDSNYFKLIELFAEKRFLNIYFKYFPNRYRSIFMFSIAKALSNKNVSPYYLIHKILEVAINNLNLDMISEVLDRLQLNNYNKFYGSFYGTEFIITYQERNNLDVLINEAKELILNL